MPAWRSLSSCDSRKAWRALSGNPSGIASISGGVSMITAQPVGASHGTENGYHVR